MGRSSFSTEKLCECLHGTALATGRESCSETGYFKTERKKGTFQKTLKQFMVYNRLYLLTARWSYEMCVLQLV